jgi:uncharacterized protein (TIGR03435 family)
MKTAKPGYFNARRIRKVFLLAALSLPALSTTPAQTTAAPPAAVHPAEAPAKPLVYDAVSIRESKCGACGGSGRTASDGDYNTNELLIFWLGAAYGVHPDLVSGLPGWAQEARYDVALKVADEDIPAFHKLSRRQKREMDQAVLADRFKLQAHIVPKEFPVYELIVAKGGPRLHDSKPGDTYADGLKMPDGTPIGGSGAFVGRGSYRGQQVAIGGILEALRGASGRRVVDKTGLTGKYDISLRWLPDNGPAPMLNGEPDTSLPNIFTAVEEQLGLKLQPAKGLEDTLVIDHIEPPSEN